MVELDAQCVPKPVPIEAPRQRPLTGAERQARLRDRSGPPIKVYVEAEVRELLVAHARKHRQPVSEVVREALRGFLKIRSPSP